MSILDAEDCWEIVNGTEAKPRRISLDDDLDNKEKVDKRLLKIKDFKKRSKKAASLITQTIDESIVMSLDVHKRNPVHMWAQFANDYNTITLAQRSAARKEFLNFVITEEETFLDFNRNTMSY